MNLAQRATTEASRCKFEHVDFEFWNSTRFEADNERSQVMKTKHTAVVTIEKLLKPSKVDRVRLDTTNDPNGKAVL